MVDGWVALQNRSIARRETLMGLPLPYAALLITSSLLLAVSMHLIGAGIYLAVVGMAIGRLVTFYDPFAWELMARNIAMPRLLRA